MLLIDDRQSEVLEDDIVFYQCVCSDYDANASVRKARMDLSSFRGLRAACQESGLHVCGGKELLNVLIMLLSKHFRRSHDTCLAPVSYGYEGCQHGDHGLSAAHISLQQPVHLQAALHVPMDFLDHPLLCPCQVERQRSVALVERLSDARHRDAVHISAAHIFLLQQRQLEHEKLLELKSVFRLLQRLHVLREVYVPECKMQRHKAILLHQPLRQSLLLLCQSLLQCRLHHLVHHLSCDAGILQLLRARIHSGQRSGQSCAAHASMTVCPALSRL